MTGKVILLTNDDELLEYQTIINEYGFEEAFSLGKINGVVKPKYIYNPILFDMDEVMTAYRINDDGRNMNVHFRSGDSYTIVYTDELWNKIKKHLEEKNGKI